MEAACVCLVSLQVLSICCTRFCERSPVSQSGRSSANLPSENILRHRLRRATAMRRRTAVAGHTVSTQGNGRCRVPAVDLFRRPPRTLRTKATYPTLADQDAVCSRSCSPWVSGSDSGRLRLRTLGGIRLVESESGQSDEYCDLSARRRPEASIIRKHPEGSHSNCLTPTRLQSTLP